MIKRNIQEEIENSLKTFPIVVILGSRQVGKTTLAKVIQKNFINSIYLDLEYPPDQRKLHEAELYLEPRKDNLVIIDEIQRKPELFPLLRSLIDKDRKPGRFLLLGSSSPDLMQKSSESLAGRIIYHELSPFMLSEVNTTKSELIKLWERGGYPESFLAYDLDTSFNWRNAFISTYIERDIPQFGFRIASTQLKNFWTMLANNNGQIWNASQIAGSMGVTYHTANNYLSILSDLFIVNILHPFKTNIRKRLIKSPKVYIRDNGLLHALLNLIDSEDLHAHPILGYSWEGFVIEQLSQHLSKTFKMFYYRTSSGNEVDLIITNANKPVAAIEIKYSLAPVLSKGFYYAMDDLNLKKGFVLYPGNDEYNIKSEVSVISAEEFILNIESYITK